MLLSTLPFVDDFMFVPRCLQMPLSPNLYPYLLLCFLECFLLYLFASPLCFCTVPLFLKSFICMNSSGHPGLLLFGLSP